MSDLATRETGYGPGDLERHRVELTGYCYRMLGSTFEAEDAVQEALTRAWRGIDRFEGRSALRSWLYRIATNVCFDMLDGRKHRARPMDLGPSSTANATLAAPMPETTWLEPVPDGRVLPAGGGDPAEQAIARESVRLAFVAALQHLPPKQRAVLILREVLRWRATEVAELLGSTVPSVNSALQRARATLDARGLTSSDPLRPMDDAQRALLERYVEAFEAYDVDSLVSLLHEEATQSMPPYPMWLRGPAELRAWWTGPGIGCSGSRLIPTIANGAPAFGQYRPAGPGRYEPFSLHVLELSGDIITGLNYFLDTARIFPLFGLPPVLEDR